MTTTNGKENDKDPGTHEKRAQTIMLAFITLIMSWSFTSLVQTGKDIATIQAQLNDLQALRSSVQPTVNQLSLDNNRLRLDVDNTIRRVSFLETKKR